MKGFSESISMEGKTCLISGGSSGVGKAIARGVASLGAGTIIIGKNRERGEAAIAEIKSETGNPQIEFVAADLSSVASTQKASDEILNRHKALHLLANIAGIISLRRDETPEGLERILATNYIGHFALTNRLLPLLKASKPSRIITVAGTAALLAIQKLNFDDPMGKARFNPIFAILRSALAKVMFTFELSRRLEGSGVTANTFDPGLVRSDLISGLPLPLRIPLSLGPLFFPRQCKTGMYLATSPDVEGSTGGYFAGSKRIRFKNRFHDRTDEKRLWEMSEEIVSKADQE